MIEVGADQLEGAGAGRDYGWSVGRNYGQGEGGGGNSWPVGGNSGSWRVLLQDSSSSRVCRVTELCEAKLLAICKDPLGSQQILQIHRRVSGKDRVI